MIIAVAALLISFKSNARRPSYSSYNEIVDKLQRHRDGSYRGYRQPSRWNGKVHAGLGLSQVAFQSSSSDGDFAGTGHRGLFLGLGLELGKSHWGVEGSFKNLGKSEGSQLTHELREFNVNIFYKTPMNRWALRTGAGFNFRLLGVDDINTTATTTHFTPGFMFLIGAETFVSKMISLGVDLNYKNAFSQTAIDHRSFDLSFRADIHF